MTLQCRMVAVVLCATLAAVAAIGNHRGSAAGPASASPPNIVLVLTDDQDETLGSLGFMPNVRATVADAGMNFTHFYVPLSLCCPSRTTVLRGQYAHNHGVVSNLPPTGGFQQAFSSGIENATLATALRQRGYRTALIGKYLNGYPLANNPTYIPPGWDEWFSPTTNGAYGGYDYTVNDDGVLRTYGHTQADYLTDVLAAEAVSYITRTVAAQPGTPFFLELAFYAPHTPANPAQRHIHLFPGLQAPRPPSFDEADVSDKPSWIQALPRLTPVEIASIDTLFRRQMQSLQAVDEAVARLVEALAQSGQLDNTYIIFTSDNGFHMGEHRLLPGKGMVYQEDSAVPFVVRGPGVAAGVNQPALASMVDLAPTLADIAGATLTVPADGRSLVPLFRGASPPSDWRRSLLLENYPIPSGDTTLTSSTYEPVDRSEAQMRSAATVLPVYTAILAADYKYVENRGAIAELYDLVNDPYELRNLISEATPAFIRQASDLLASYKSCAGSRCRTVDRQPPPPLQLVSRPRLYLPSVRAR